MQFAIRYTTEYHYDAPVTDNLNALRVRPATTPSQHCDEFHTLILPEARVSRYLDYFGTEVLEFGVPTAHQELTIDVRARVATSAPGGSPARSLGGARRRALPDVAGEFALPWQDHPPVEGIADLAQEIRGDSPRAAVERLCESFPGSSNTARGDVRRVRDQRPPGCGGRRVPGLCAPLAGLAAPPRDRRPLRLRLPLGRPRDGGRVARGRDPRLDRGIAARLRRRGSRSGSAPTRPTAASPTKPT